MKWHLEGHEEPADAPVVKQGFGSANPCPQCGSPGFLDHIDIIDRVQFEHCPDCGYKWEQTETELTEV